MSEEMAMELRMALTSLSMALSRCKTDDQKSAAKEILFDSTQGIVALEQLENVLGLVMVDRDEVVKRWEMGPLTIELTQRVPA